MQRHDTADTSLPEARYDSLAEWYDAWARGNPLFTEVLLPGMLSLVGDLARQRILDLACGSGIVARELAWRGARVVGVDLSDELLELACREEAREPLGIRYLRDDAQRLTALAEASFDGVTCNMALMDIPDLAATFAAVHRVLEPGGRLVFSITHPCFETPQARWVTRDDGAIAPEVRGYFDEGEWQSSDPHGLRGRVGARHRMLSTYLNALSASGFRLERMVEPTATAERLAQVPGVREVPTVLFVRAIWEPAEQEL